RSPERIQGAVDGAKHRHRKRPSLPRGCRSEPSLWLTSTRLPAIFWILGTLRVLFNDEAADETPWRSECSVLTCCAGSGELLLGRRSWCSFWRWDSGSVLPGRS